jgi:fructoselysine-6-P-deglycase FrlB-like protein
MQKECDEELVLEAVSLREWNTVDEVVSGTHVLNVLGTPPTRKAVRDALRRLETSGRVVTVFRSGKTRFAKAT